MPTPLPAPDNTNLQPPDDAAVAVLARGVVSAISTSEGLTPLQRILVVAMFDAMTGHHISADVEPITPAEFAAALADRNEAFRTRMVQVMLLGALVLRPLPEEVADQVDSFARELSVAEGMLAVAHKFAEGALGLAALDFDRNGYTSEWSADDQHALHTSEHLADAWAMCADDPSLADRWRCLEDLPEGTLGRRVTEMYRARGFHYPGIPGSAPPLLAQHDWVHVLADYGTKVESELEVFAFIARANDDPKAFSLLAMVVSLFETGYLSAGAGLFEAFPGQLAHEGVAVRLADAMRRGALINGSVDYMAVDWFDIAERQVDDLRAEMGVVPKSEAAIAAGSVGPFDPGGISPFQEQSGKAAAEAEGRPYECYGASVE